jgi:hypothetical protein
MGAGEQKVVRLVSELEQIPNKSLILLEEPELTLHPDAHAGLVCYLLHLAKRKGHQVIIATHSPWIFDAIPQAGRLLMTRSPAGTQVLNKVESLRSARELARVHYSNKDLIVVEDTFAKTMVEEMFRRYDRPGLENSTVVNVGSHDDVRRLVKAMRLQNVRAVGILDPDQNPSASDGILAIPGGISPEEMLLEPAVVTTCERTLSGVVQAASRSNALGLGKTGSDAAKAILAGVAIELREEHERVVERLTLAWLENNEPTARQTVKEISDLLTSSGSPAPAAPTP